MNEVTTGQMPNFNSWQNNRELLQQSDKLKYRKILNSQLHYFRDNWSGQKNLNSILSEDYKLVDEGNCLHVINLIFAGHQK